MNSRRFSRNSATASLLALSLLAATWLGIAHSKAAQLPGNLIQESGIVFGKGGDQPLLLDMIRPKGGKGPFPALIFVHGGGWVGGTRGDLLPLMPHFAEEGIVCVTIDYRLAPKSKFPAQLEDVKCAVRWMHANAKKYNVDPDRIGAIGGSAGAHLVALLGTAIGQKRWEGNGGYPDAPSAICAMLCLSGPYDLELGYRDSVKQNAAEGGAVRGMLGEFLGGAPEQEAALYRDASPMTYAGKTTVSAFLTHGTADPLVPIEQSDLFYAKLKAASVDVELMRIDGAGHADYGKHPEEVLAKADAFIAKHLLGPQITAK